MCRCKLCAHPFTEQEEAIFRSLPVGEAKGEYIQEDYNYYQVWPTIENLMAPPSINVSIDRDELARRIDEKKADLKLELERRLLRPEDV